MKVIAPTRYELVIDITDAINECIKLHGLTQSNNIAALIAQRLTEKYVILEGVEK